MNFLSLLTFVFLLALPVQANAQAIEYLQTLERLNEINSYKPEQSPHHERGTDVLTDRVLDKKNQVIGEVRDVILDERGEIVMLDVEFDRLKLGRDRLTLSYTDMQIEPAGNGYKMGFSREQIKELFPILLANINTAAGTEGDIVSMKTLQGASVKSEDGRSLGKVKDVLFSSLGGKAEFLHLNIRHRNIRDEAISIPFDAARYIERGNTVQVIVNDDVADAIIAYIKD